MNTSGIQRLQATQYQSSLQTQTHGREDVERAVDEHGQQVETAYQESLKEIEKEAAARKTQSIWTLIGAIVLGPLIGSAIGGAIGGAANDGDEDAAREAHKKSELASLEADKAFEHFEDARSDLEDQQRQAKDVQKFARELRDAGWTGTN